jgi:hypothetical protein
MDFTKVSSFNSLYAVDFTKFSSFLAPCCGFHKILLLPGPMLWISQNSPPSSPHAVERFAPYDELTPNAEDFAAFPQT